MSCFDERVDDSDQLSGDGCDDDLVRFSCSAQTIGEGLENRIVMPQGLLSAIALAATVIYWL